MALNSLLATMTYSNTSLLPTEGARTLTFQTHDGDDPSNLADSVVTVARDAQSAAWSLTGTATVNEGNDATDVVGQL